MKVPNPAIAQRGVDDILNHLSRLPIIEFPDTLPDGIEVDVDPARATYLIDGDSEVHEHRFSKPGMFCTSPKVCLLRGEPLITFEIEFGHYSYRYIWFQGQITHFHSHAHIHDNGHGITVLGKRLGDPYLATWHTGELIVEPLVTGSTRTTAFTSGPEPKASSAQPEDHSRFFLLGFLASAVVLIGTFYGWAYPGLMDWRESQQIPESSWVPARMKYCSTGRNRSTWVIDTPEGKLVETSFFLRCPDEQAPLEVASFRDGWISSYKVDDMFPYLESMFIALFLVGTCAFGWGWLEFRSLQRRRESTERQP